MGSQEGLEPWKVSSTPVLIVNPAPASPSSSKLRALRIGLVGFWFGACEDLGA